MAPDVACARVLLVEAPEAPGACAHDAALRARMLELALGKVATCTPSQGAAGSDPRRALAATISRLGPELVVFASPSRNGDVLEREALACGAAWWWPTGIGVCARFWLPWRPARALAALPAVPGNAGLPAADPPGLESLAWTPQGATGGSRPRLSLWDGRYLLAPVPLRGAAGVELLETFAGLDAHWNRVDLVVLGAAQPDFQRRARALGIGARVHFAGAAVADAELAWLAAAAAVVIGRPGPIASSLVLRALACGAPLVAFGTLAVPLHHWLAARHVVPTGWAGPESTARARLEQALEHDPAVETGGRRGREIAELHGPEVLAARLRVALGTPRRRAA